VSGKRQKAAPAERCQGCFRGSEYVEFRERERERESKNQAKSGLGRGDFSKHVSAHGSPHQPLSQLNHKIAFYPEIGKRQGFLQEPGEMRRISPGSGFFGI
jgi:hypothetical protein